MRVLYVVGTNLNRNTSANISHNAYVQGLLENGCSVDILMANESWGVNDSALPSWDQAQYYTYNSISFLEKFKTFFKKKLHQNDIQSSVIKGVKEDTKENLKKNNLKGFIFNTLKKNYKLFFSTTNPYKLEKIWLKNASYFKSDIEYDLIISNSSPAASHKLVFNLLSKNKIKGTRWVQIWEDPWYYDIYGGNNDTIRKEEYKLLKAAQEIYYVSVLTLQYQKKYFKDFAEKMKHLPLPFLQISEDQPKTDSEKFNFGYFGDYYTKTRNLKPFYEALVESNLSGIICGDSDLLFTSNSNVKISKRITLDKLSILQSQTDILVHLCNLKGGQIPGKIYHYSATTKPILFILDGTYEEIKIIKNYFIKFNRYVFCENNKDSIFLAINSILDRKNYINEKPVFEFHPKQVILKLLNNEY